MDPFSPKTGSKSVLGTSEGLSTPTFVMFSTVPPALLDFWRRVEQIGAQPHASVDRALAIHHAARHRCRLHLVIREARRHVSRSARGVARAVAQLNTGRTVRRGETLAAPSGAATHVALAVAPQQRPPAVRSTPPTGASRTPSLCGGFCNALTMLCATTRQLHGHDRVVLHVERRPPAPQPRRDRAAARPRTIARPHPLYKSKATSLPRGRSSAP